MTAVLARTLPKSKRNQNELLSNGPNSKRTTTLIAANPKTIKTKQERDRLTRMEAMLDELLLLKTIIVEAKKFRPPENNHANQN